MQEVYFDHCFYQIRNLVAFILPNINR